LNQGYIGLKHWQIVFTVTLFACKSNHLFVPFSETHWPFRYMWSRNEVSNYLSDGLSDARTS